MSDIKQKIENSHKQIEEQIKKAEEKLENEIGKFEIAEKKASEKGFPGKSSRHLELLKYYTDLKERLEKVQKGLKINTEELEKHSEKAHKKKKKYTEKDIEDLMYFYDDASRSIEASIKIASGKEFEDLSAGKTDTFPTKENLDSINKIPEKECLKQFREKHTHKLLAGAELLRNREESLKGLGFLKEEDLEKAEEFRKNLDDISKELTRRASKLDSFLLKASVKLNKAENREKNYS
jgi:hypothetical protein